MIRDTAFDAKQGLSYLDLARLLQEVDCVTVHTPVRPAARLLTDRENLRTMKSTAYLANASRGPVVEEALYLGLTNGDVAGAAVVDAHSVYGRSPENGIRMRSPPALISQAPRPGRHRM